MFKFLEHNLHKTDVALHGMPPFGGSTRPVMDILCYMAQYYSKSSRFMAHVHGLELGASPFIPECAIYAFYGRFALLGDRRSVP